MSECGRLGSSWREGCRSPELPLGGAGRQTASSYPTCRDRHVRLLCRNIIFAFSLSLTVNNTWIDGMSDWNDVK